MLELSVSATYSVTTNTDMALNDVPIIAGHTYGIHIHSVVQWVSVAVGARWDFYIRWNGVDHRRVAVICPGVTGTTFHTIDAMVPWKPAVTASTDDLVLRASESVDGADITLSGSATLTRTMSLFDFGAV